MPAQIAVGRLANPDGQRQVASLIADMVGVPSSSSRSLGISAPPAKLLIHEQLARRPSPT
jgi:hypothetical protein